MAATPRKLRFSDAHDLAKSLGERTRLTVLALLVNSKSGEMNVGEICEKLGQSQPATSHHLALMRHQRILTVRRDGKNNYYALTDDPIVSEIVTAFLLAVDLSDIVGTKRAPKPKVEEATPTPKKKTKRSTKSAPEPAEATV